jgi:hypothetical protein
MGAIIARTRKHVSPSNPKKSTCPRPLESSGPIGQLGSALSALAALACGPGRDGHLARFPEGAPVVWQYDVHAGQAGVDDLLVDARFAPKSAGDLRVDEDAAPFVHDVAYASGATWLRATAAEDGWSIPCASGCRVRYRFALRAAATTLRDAETAIASGGVVVAPPFAWLLRPADPGPRWRFRFHVSHDITTRFAAGTHPSPDGQAETFEAFTQDLGQSSFAVFGRFREEEIRSAGARVLVAVAPDGLTLSDTEVAGWVGRAVHAIATYLGRFPSDRTLVVVQPGSGGPTRGATLGDGGPAVLVRVGEGVDAAAVRDDWVVTHELLHVSLPSFSREHAWLDEGIPTYVEPVVRARDGQITPERFWGDLVLGLPQGQPGAADRGLERTHTWGRTYWGGALFCLVADVTLRERTKNVHSFDDVLRAIVASGANVETHWEIDKFLEVGDRATGTRVLHELYARLAVEPGAVDLAALWARLGVVPHGDRVTFDDKAPLAGIRRSVTAP